jgi:Cu(I)/Ag(I) efflux system membrane protein CusA/SilA
MITRLVAWSARHHRSVIGVTMVLALVGVLARRSLVRDVVPDLSDPQIVVAAEWVGHPASEVAAVTERLSRSLADLPGSTAVRAWSMAGLAYLDVVFRASADLTEGRRAIVERIERVRTALPAQVHVQVGPEASSTGWVFQYALTDPSHGQTPLSLRRLQDEILRPALSSIPGVAEVASVGGGFDQPVVDVHASALRARSVAFSDVLSVLRVALAPGRRTGWAELEALPLPVTSGTAPSRIGDVASLRTVHDMSSGMADLSAGPPAVGAIVVAHRDASVPALVAAVKAALESARPKLPPGIRIATVYDRSELAARAERSLMRVLVEEVAVMALVIAVFLLHLRSASIALVTLPVVLLVTFVAMWLLDVPATIMSLGGIGIALGMAVDAEVVALEACHRRLERAGEDLGPAERRAALVAAAGSVAPALLVSLVIAAISFLPVFAFDGETGRLLRPLAMTKTLVFAAAALVAVTLAPALRDRLLKGRVRAELANPLTRGLIRLYRPFVELALRRPGLTMATAALALVSCLPLLSRLGGEFLPRVDEGDLLFMPTTLPGAPAGDLGGQLLRQNRIIGRFEEVASVFGKVGRADTATDPAPMSMIETTVRLRPREQWPAITRLRWYSRWAPGFLRPALGLVWPERSRETTSELVQRLDRATRLPGWTAAWTAPARARLDMMSTGIRTPVGIRLFGRDAERLDALAAMVRAMVMRLPGTRSVTYESLGGETRLEFVADAAALARHHVDAAVVEATAAAVLSGRPIGELERDGRHVPVRVAQDLNTMGPADQLRVLTVQASPAAGPIPLALLGRPSFITRPATLRSEQGQAVAYLYVDLTPDAELVGYVHRARAMVERAVAAHELRLEAGERVEWAGQYELVAAGQRRLRWIVPMVLGSMIVLLFLQFRNKTETIIVLASVPFALVGSVWTLFLLGYSLSAPVWVGLLSVTGLALQTGVVMVVFIDEAFHRRLREGRLAHRDDIVAAHAEGTVLRLRPKLMTVFTMGASLVPLLWAEGAAAEIMKRVAAPMIGGLASSAFLTLEVIPVLYTVWRHRQLLHAQRTGKSLASIVGPPPSWARP